MHGLQQDCPFPYSCLFVFAGETPMAERETQMMESARMTMSLPSKLPQLAHPVHQHFVLTPHVFLSEPSAVHSPQHPARHVCHVL